MNERTRHQLDTLDTRSEAIARRAEERQHLDELDSLEGHSGDCAWCGHASHSLDEYRDHERGCNYSGTYLAEAEARERRLAALERVAEAARGLDSIMIRGDNGLLLIGGGRNWDYSQALNDLRSALAALHGGKGGPAQGRDGISSADWDSQ